MQPETELFFESIIREDRSVLDLLNANYTFVNERLAQHYGIPNVYGSRASAACTLTDDSAPRVARTSQHSDGDFVCHAHFARAARQMDSDQHPRHAAPAAAAQRAGAQGKQRRRKGTSVRERMEEHRKNPGLRELPQDDGPDRLRAREFRRHRPMADQERRRRADRSPPGVCSMAPRSMDRSALRAALMSRPEVFVATLTEKLMTYALGRGVDYYDMPAVRAIVATRGCRPLPFFGICCGNREEPAVPNEDQDRAGCGQPGGEDCVGN